MDSLSLWQEINRKLTWKQYLKCHTDKNGHAISKYLEFAKAVKKVTKRQNIHKLCNILIDLHR